MYPNIKITCNIAEHTQLGRIIIDKKILQNENPLNEEKYMRASKFIEDIESDDPAVIGKWLNLPDVSNVMNEYTNKFHTDTPINIDIDDLGVDYDDNGRIIIHSRRLYRKESGNK